MSCVCGSKSGPARLKTTRWRPHSTELQIFKQKYRFNDNEIIEFRNRFDNLANSKNQISKFSFRENMGLLGLDSGFFLSDRIFNLIDQDKDGLITFEDYLNYFDILINGNEDEKQQLTFDMIDMGRNSYFTFEDYWGMIFNMMNAWNNITGSHYNIQQNEKLKVVVQTVFDKFDIDKTGKITFTNFKTVIDKEPQLLEIFDFFNKGILDSIGPPAELDKVDLEVIEELNNLHTRVAKLKEYLIHGLNENIETPKEKTEEIDTRKSASKKESRISKGKVMLQHLDSNIRKTIFFEPIKGDSVRAISPANMLESRARLQRNSTVHMQLRNSSLYTPEQSKTDPANHAISHRHLTTENWDENDMKENENNTIKQEAPFTPRNDGGVVMRSNLKKHSRFSKPQDQPITGSPFHDDNILKTRIEITFLPQKFVPDDADEIRISTVDMKDFNFKDLKTLKSEDTLRNFGTPNFNQNMDTEKGSEEMRRIKVKFEPVEPIDSNLMDPQTPTPDKIMGLDLIKTRSLPDKLTKIQTPKAGMSTFNQMKNDEKLFKSELSPAVPSDASMTFANWPGWSEQDMITRIGVTTGQLEKIDQKMLFLIDEIKNKHRKQQAEVKEQEPKKIEQMAFLTSKNVPKVKNADGFRKDAFISFGHPNWNLVLNMIFGIQMAVRSNPEKIGMDQLLTSKDFGTKYIFELVPRRTGNTKNYYKICKFHDYAPSVFNEIRKMYGIKSEDYLQSIGPVAMLNNLVSGNLQTLAELTSSGKSGSFFYYSADGRFVLKTISRSEFLFIRSILKNYFNHLVNNPQSLIIKFFGVHKLRFIKSKAQEKIYFIIMANVFNTSKQIHVRYDLKGSTHGRKTTSKDPSIARKDLDFIENTEKIDIPANYADILKSVLEEDTKFFIANNIIDYSLLVGIHKIENGALVDTSEFLPDQTEVFKTPFRDGVLSSDGTRIFFFGIIDILSEFNTRKKFEFIFKRISMGKGISAVPAEYYGKRFLKFIIQNIERGPSIQRSLSGAAPRRDDSTPIS